MTSQFNPHPQFDPSMARTPRKPWLDDERSEDDFPELDDRFELLSAYLDGEATVEERQQVEAWLATDAEARLIYERMSNLNDEFQSLPMPAPSTCAKAIAQGVFDRLDAQRQRRNVRWGGAVAAALIAVVSGMTLNNRFDRPQMAESPQQTENHRPQVALKNDARQASLSSSVAADPSLVSRALFVE